MANVDLWAVSEKLLLVNIHRKLDAKEYAIKGGYLWKIKKSETDYEKGVHPDYVLLDEGGAEVYPLSRGQLIRHGVECGYLEDCGPDNAKYKLVTP